MQWEGEGSDSRDDPFHEVKSRREKKKEIKDTSESRPRGVSTSSNRGGRTGGGRGGSTQFNSYDSGVLHGKPAYKKENGAADLSSSSNSAYGTAGTYGNRRPVSFSDSVTAENKLQTTGTIDSISSSSQPGYQSAWVGAPGQVSMADIVKMGRPKASGTTSFSAETSRPVHKAAASTVANHNVHHAMAPASHQRESHHGLEVSQESAPKVLEPSHETGIQHVATDEWTLLEKSSASAPSTLESSIAETYKDPSVSSSVHSDRTKLHLDSWSDEVRGTERDVAAEHLNASYLGSASASGRQIPGNNSGGASHFDKDSFNKMNPYPSQGHSFDHLEDNGGSSQLSDPNYSVSSVEDVTVAVSAAAANLQQLSLQEEQGARTSEVNPAVIIPNHLQIPTAECSHLSFGSFGSVVNGSFSGSYASNSLKSNLEETSVAANITSSDHSETRGPEYFGDEHLHSTSDGNIAPRTSAGAGSYESPSQPEVMKQDAGEAIHGHQYNFPTSVPGYTLDNSAQLNAAFTYEQASSQMHNLAPLMQAYSNSLQGNPMAAPVQPTRESSDLAYAQFLATQSMPTKYSTAASSVSGPSLSMPESVKPGMYSMPHPSAQTLPGTNIATGPTLPQHLAVHPYSQPTLPLGHFANMIGYPFLPQSYGYMPSAYQQAYAASAYGFGNSANVPGSFPLNPSTTPASTTIGYDDVLGSQYKESNHFLPLQQNDSSTVWVQGPGSRTVSALPASTYYSFQGQGQQHSGFRQAQQPSQHYGNLGYQNFYHSQAGVSQEHQQQTQNEGTLNGSQGPSSKQSHQIWQHSY
ncbi:Rna polymerase ii degradation factor-like protein [Thalictrum thalictroides]|uniref:Rna polymerase ii degradation factor-like protein n=1 Tax=Thalictrum thalictroides TaxID=46969 RepID=A0A7J6WZD1_THATH|nr:Rna polymerase ii degradation factor-like protein [Thalictrum thalictroides]